jgi:transposase
MICSGDGDIPAGIEQRWLVVQSQERRESDLRKLTQKITKAESKAVQDLKKLSQEEFACEADAIKALSKLSKQFKYHQINESKVTQVKSTIKNQLGKATDRPTLRWIFQCFQSIHLVTLNQGEHISNWNQDRDFILRLLPDDCLRYYQLVT